MEIYISEEELVAPCGIYCGVCIVYLRSKNRCSGCNKHNENKPKHCITCSISNCDDLGETGTRSCYHCKKFPCRRLKQLDARYRKNYQTSLIDNLKHIQENGINLFLENESEKWTCPHCNNIRSMHKNVCTACDKLI